MCQLTKGRNELTCRNNIGGINKVYLFKFDSYDITQIVRSGQTVTSFPTTAIYEFWNNTANFTENVSNDENGVTFNQSLTFTLTKTDLTTTNQLNSIKDLFFRYIVEFNDGSLRIGGLYNGANLSFIINSGGGKADGTNYDITIEGIEEISAPYLDNLNDFTIQEYLLLEDGTALLLEDGGYLILE